MLQQDMGHAVQAWSALEAMVYVPHTEEKYQRLIVFLDAFMDEVGEDETHPLASLMEVVGVLIERYEEEYMPELTRSRRSLCPQIPLMVRQPLHGVCAL